MKCEKCFRHLHTCQACNGRPGQSILGDPLTCSKCHEGLVCSNHGKHWKR
ncbi:hypothetical protein [Nocardiopsis sp. Huas11]|nr:hypothetical protein [Nocardiopsis sp. Huas11]